MRRQTKGAIVKKFVDKKTKREGEMRLNKDSMIFFAKIGEEYKESKDGREVERWIEAELRKTDEGKSLTWIPVIECKVIDESRHYYRDEKGKSATLGVELDRYYVALAETHPQKGERWVTLKWEEADSDSSAKIDDALMYSQSTVYLEFADPDRSYGEKFKKSMFRLPSSSQVHQGIEYYLPYTPELWEGAMEVVLTLQRAKKTLADLFTTKKGIEFLQGGGQLRLGSGS